MPTGSLKYKGTPRDELLNLSSTLGTGLNRLIVKRLHLFKNMSTGCTLVLVYGHPSTSS